MEPRRSLATILFTDIVGSTERAAELRDVAWRDLRQQHDRLVRRQLRRFGGHEINTAGDSFLAAFGRPARAIACAGAIRAAVRELGLEVRAGLHVGEVEGSGREVAGLALHIGARVASEAGPGEVLVSQSVHDALAGSEFDFDDRGVRALKGVPGEWRLFEVTSMPTDAGEALPRWLRRTPTRQRALLAGAVAATLLTGLYVVRRDADLILTPEEVLAADAAPGIAIMPFTVNDSSLATWREGMVDLLTVNLDGVPGLRPIASRTVLARWHEEVPGVADLTTTLGVARRTGARYALVGNAVAIGPQVRFAADLYDARTGELLGSARAQGSPDSVFALVDRLSLEIVRALPQGEEGVIPALDLANVTTDSLAALKAYLEGEARYRRADFEMAVAAFERAVAADSTFALALYRMSDACGWTSMGPECGEYLARAVAHADRLPPRFAALARASLASARASFDGIEPLRRAIQRYPDDPEAWYILGEIYEHLGDQILIDREEAVRAFTRATELDPTFAPYYEHLIGHALDDADSARAASLIMRHGRLAPGSEYDRAFRLAFALSFGDQASRRRARAAMDTVDTSLLVVATVNGLWHPRNLSVQAEAFRILRARPDAPSWMLMEQFQNLLNRGGFDAAEALLHDPLLHPRLKTWGTYRLYLAGMDLSDRTLDEALALSAIDTAAGAAEFLIAGAYAADRGRWGEHAAVLGEVRSEAGRRRAAGDTVAARLFEGAAKALEGYELWKRGRPAEAVVRLEAVQQSVRGFAVNGRINLMVRWWLGDLLVALDRPREALRYYQSLWDPSGEYESARIYESLWEYEKARHSYEYALLAWQEADPELQPRIQEASRALARMPKPVGRQGR